ncbi:hypothetical protein TELCIR_13852 [Teladorsagia circumcincta]|uniref:Uncharacterized protein n=1 Tax=Teladorsagia circumcincta TaxID=45464 RepID=A0A2G9U2P2_TELCI|nr:hypothetical protein TELCIR_13852 [Teladorsagia circumcincta]
MKAVEPSEDAPFHKEDVLGALGRSLDAQFIELRRAMLSLANERERNLLAKLLKMCTLSAKNSTTPEDKTEVGHELYAETIHATHWLVHCSETVDLPKLNHVSSPLGKFFGMEESRVRAEVLRSREDQH